MSLLDDVINTGRNVVSAAGKKTDEAVRFSKLKIKESQLNGDIKNKFEKLGALIYQMAKSGEKDNEQFDAYIAEIDGCYEELNGIAKQLDELRNEVTCPGCGAKSKDENAYCPKCGTKLPEKPAPEEPAETDTIDEDKGGE
ncbi:MAG: hypothetical protein NC299_00150 [Lachnospiraceae bacterium]|nr:hypothetical protein [Ruminococcus sp.]MCM1273757.1 hypothetical protein [Lachnospiraceae bacterium]